MILRFVCLSVAAHGMALVALHAPAPPWSLPAPELRIHLLDDAREVALPRRAREAVSPAQTSIPTLPSSAAIDRPPTAEPPGVMADSPIDDNAENESQAQRANHLRSVWYAELKHYFVYPALARRHGWEGRVEVSLRLDPDGRLSDLRLVRSSGYAILDLNAVETLQRIGALPQTSAGLVGHPQELALLIVYQLLDS